jgi:pimeloyl-ACP methyl ester carboxylesterase
VSHHQTISGKWILRSLALLIAAAALLTWAMFCLIFWQGSWQLLYHPTSAVTRTPASVGLQFDSVSFSPDSAGIAQLHGWLIHAENDAPANRSKWTVLYIHGATGNLGDTVEALESLHATGLNVYAYDPRGYGESKFERPSEKKALEDADAALKYLTNTRHVAAQSIVVMGNDLGANVALEFASQHSSLAGVVVDEAQRNATDAIFNDKRAKIVPAHLLVSDRYDLATAAREVRVPVLWIERDEETKGAEFELIEKTKMRVFRTKKDDFEWFKDEFGQVFARWVDDL